MKSKTKFFKSIVYCLSKPSFAGEIVEKRSGVGYLARLSLLISAILAVALLFNTYVINDFNDLINEMRAEIPYFELKGGELRLDINEPIIIDSNQSLLVIHNGYDTAIMDEYKTYSGQKVFINNNSITMYQGAEVTTVDLSNIPFTLTKESLISVAKFFIMIAPLIFLIVKFIGLLLTGMFMALIIAVVGLIFNSEMHTELSFKNLYTLSLFSLTGVYLLEGIMSLMRMLTQLNIPTNIHIGISYLSMGLFLFLYLNALKKSKQDKQAIDTDDMLFSAADNINSAPPDSEQDKNEN